MTLISAGIVLLSSITWNVCRGTTGIKDAKLYKLNQKRWPFGQPLSWHSIGWFNILPMVLLPILALQPDNLLLSA
jgi:hypothetical protein